VLELAGRGIRAERGGKRMPSVTYDVDSAPIEGEPARATGSSVAANGHQPKAEWNGHYDARIYHPLITSIAETGGMLDARLRAGNVGTADGALDVILDVVDRALSSTSRAKSHWRGKKLKSRTPAVDAFACNEVRLLVACLACQIMHIARRAMAKATEPGWSLRRLRERVLRAGTRLVISGRRMVPALSSPAAPSGPCSDPGSSPAPGRSIAVRHRTARDTETARGRPAVMRKGGSPASGTR